MQQIANWLGQLGLGQYAERFTENEIDVSVLRLLTDQDLKDIGVPLGHRRKILAAIAELSNAPMAAPIAASPVSPQAAAGTAPNSSSVAPEAAGEIHTDFQKHFIKAEIVSYDDLITAGSMAAVRAAGKARVEGKEYVMRDGDTAHFRFNV